MKIACAIVFVACLLSTSLQAQNVAGAERLRDEASLKKALLAQVDSFMHAWQRQDAAALTATMAPEFLYVSSQGVTPRDGVIAALTHVCTVTSYRLSDVQIVNISSDSAALVYKIHQSASCAGHAEPPVSLNTDTLVRRDGQWMFLMTTTTPLR